MIPAECLKAWHKLGVFFNFFYVKDNDGNAKAINSLVEKKLISKFVNLVTKFKINRPMKCRFHLLTNSFLQFLLLSGVSLRNLFA